MELWQQAWLRVGYDYSVRSSRIAGRSYSSRSRRIMNWIYGGKSSNSRTGDKSRCLKAAGLCEPPYPYPKYRPLFCPGLLRHRNSERNSDSELQTDAARYSACCCTSTSKPTYQACRTRFGHTEPDSGMPNQIWASQTGFGHAEPDSGMRTRTDQSQDVSISER